MIIEYHSVPLVKHVCNALEREINNAVRKQKMTYSQIQLLLKLSLSDNKILPLKELEVKLNVSQATIAGLTKRLEQKGFIELLDDTHDKRVKHARLTELGNTKCDEAHEHMDRIELNLTSGFDESDVKIFNELLQKAYNNIK